MPTSPWTPEQAVEHWAIGLAAVGVAGGRVRAGSRDARRRSRSRWPGRWRSGPLGHAGSDASPRRCPAALEQVAAELRGGGTVAAAVERLAYGGGAVGADLHRVHVRTQLGLGTRDALAGWPASTTRPVSAPRPARSSVAAAMGGRPPTPSTGWPASLRHRLDAMAEARALSAQARLSAVVVGAAPLGYLAFSSARRPRVRSPCWSTPASDGSASCSVSAWRRWPALWIRRIVRSAG